MRTVVGCAVAVLLLVGLTACGGSVSGTAAVGTVIPIASSATATSSTATSTQSSSTATSTSATERTTATSSSDDTLASGVTIDELRNDLATAPQVIDGYWSRHWSDFFTGTYTSPTVVGLYDGSDPSDTPSCGGKPLEADNASYCEQDDSLAWDANLLVHGADQIGDSWVYLVIAHEWGHAVQARLDGSLVAVAEELQADCLGAAALYGAAADGTLTFDMGDDAELIASLTTLADTMPWTMTSDHGDPFQRVQWFTLGRNGGVNACLDAPQTPDGAIAPSGQDSVPPSAPPTA